MLKRYVPLKLAYNPVKSIHVAPVSFLTENTWAINGRTHVYVTLWSIDF